MDQDNADDIIPTEPSQSTSKEDDCCLDNNQSASEDESKDLLIHPKRTQKAPEKYNPMTRKSCAQKNTQCTGVDEDTQRTGVNEDTQRTGVDSHKVKMFKTKKSI